MSVTVDQVVKVVIANADNARGLVCEAAPRMKDHMGPCKHGCQTALEHAVMTNPAIIARRKPKPSAMLPKPSMSTVMSMVNTDTVMPAH